MVGCVPLNISVQTRLLTSGDSHACSDVRHTKLSTCHVCTVVYLRIERVIFSVLWMIVGHLEYLMFSPQRSK
jgi:hypothetical protein